MKRALRDPRIRLLLVAAISVLALALAWHLLMGLHPMAMMLGLCIAVLTVASLLLVPARLVLGAYSLPPAEPVQPVWRPRVEPIGRHPPDEGIRLRR
jgi:hypothetical protein